MVSSGSGSSAGVASRWQGVPRSALTLTRLASSRATLTCGASVKSPPLPSMRLFHTVGFAHVSPQSLFLSRAWSPADAPIVLSQVLTLCFRHSCSVSVPAATRSDCSCCATTVVSFRVKSAPLSLSRTFRVPLRSGGPLSAGPLSRYVSCR